MLRAAGAGPAPALADWRSVLAVSSRAGEDSPRCAPGSAPRAALRGSGGAGMSSDRLCPPCLLPEPGCVRGGRRRQLTAVSASGGRANPSLQPGAWDPEGKLVCSAVCVLPLDGRRGDRARRAVHPGGAAHPPAQARLSTPQGPLRELKCTFCVYCSASAFMSNENAERALRAARAVRASSG